jgi:hypothetical protein
MLSKHLAVSILLIFSIAFIPLNVCADKVNQTTSTSRVLLKESFVIPAVAIGGIMLGQSCFGKDLSENITAGTEIFGTIKSSWTISFFIMNDTQYKLADRICSHFAASDMTLKTGAITSYSLDWTAQSTDKYHFFFFNRSANDVSVSVTLWTQQTE